MLGNVLLLVLDTAFGFITLMLLARFFMQWQRVSFRNQVGAFVVATTDWLVRPLRRVIPGVLGLDLASLLPAWVLQTLFVFIELSLRGAALNGNPGALILGLWGLGLLEVARMAIYLVFGVVLMSAILSWVSPHAPAAPVFHNLSAPFLRPFRRILPPIANVDLSPLVLLLVLQIVLMLLGGLRGNFASLLVG
ncbi:YggT family protein [Aromatoleum petrolei]|uniref:YggT family protein n=1 Tax=Aromatoleum petrolei TaxID=76116 RepID=A0ABX1MSZ1_9RHOO|nr:YggT family protein [Aromatoleum petrolei]NMF91088.1 YggT family protein [Aromatoleum petrolei]QTQ35961.1 CCB3/YggT-containing protein [Aromatoleum petrolei]